MSSVFLYRNDKYNILTCDMMIGYETNGMIT